MFSFFGKKEEQEPVEEKQIVYKRPESIKVENAYLAKCKTISSRDVGAGTPVVITNYFLVYQEEDRYYEVFSGVEISKESEYFDSPKIVELDPIKKFLRAQETKEIPIEVAFGFVHKENVNYMADALFDVEKDDDSADEEDDDLK